MKKSLRFVAIAGVLASSVLFAADGRAGLQISPYFECATSTSGGYCYGTFLGARTDNNNNDDAAFTMIVNTNGSVGYYFYGTYQGVNHTCTAPAPQSSAIAAGLASRGYFDVSWNAAGECTYVQIDNDSAFSETW
jgi:hypothetical protein